jgi:hypothetical protein
MSEKTYLVRLKHPLSSIWTIFASTAEMQGEHLILLNARGQPAALFFLELVESFNILRS